MNLCCSFNGISPIQVRTVELFCGIGGFRIASEQLGIETVWANDICAKACDVYRDCFGEGQIQQGDLQLLKHTIPEHDLLTAGFPCQPFSSAGLKKGLRDVRGTLFELIVDVIKEKQPLFFILENVKRLLMMEQGSHLATILGALLELNYIIEWRLLNAQHFGLPQNRERVLIIGSRLDVCSQKSANVLNIKLAPIEDLIELDQFRINQLFNLKSWKAIEDHRSRFPTWGIAQDGRFFGLDLTTFSLKSSLVTLESILQDQVEPVFDLTESTLKWIEKNTPVNRLVNGVEIISNQRGGARMGYTIYGIKGVSPTLTSTTSRHYERYYIKDRYRRLTNVEYARIQGFPDGHCRNVSRYDQYSLYGNAVPPPMVQWVMSRLFHSGIELNKLMKFSNQLTLDELFVSNLEIDAISRILSIEPLYIGVIDAIDNWVLEVHGDFGRFPNTNEWQRLLISPLNGLIGMSPALQWRYNFSGLFEVS